MLRLDFKVLLVVALALHSAHGRRCFMCDSETSEGLCINSPGTVPFGTTECPGGEDYYCYTTKIEEQMQNSIKMTVNRSCCKVTDRSRACPQGDDYQEIDRLTTQGYRITHLRCQEDLCNDDVDDEEAAEYYGDGALIVEGVAEDYDFFCQDCDDDDDEDGDEDEDEEEDEDEADSEEEDEEDSGAAQAMFSFLSISVAIVCSANIFN